MAQPSLMTPSLASCRGTESILSVERNAEIRGLIVEQLRSLGYRVTPAASADEALGLLEEGAERFALLLSGSLGTAKLAGMDLAGMDLAGIARARWPWLGVLLVSGMGMGNENPFPFLLKPFRKKQLAETVRLALTTVGDRACA